MVVGENSVCQNVEELPSIAFVAGLVDSKLSTVTVQPVRLIWATAI